MRITLHPRTKIQRKGSHAGPALMSAGVFLAGPHLLLQAPRTQLMWNTDKRQEEALEGGRGPVISKEAEGSGEKRLPERYPGWRHRLNATTLADSPPGLHPPFQGCSGVVGRGTWVGGRRYSPWWAGGLKPPLGPEKSNCWLGLLSLSFPYTHPQEEGIQRAWSSTRGRIRQALNMLSGKFS